MSTAQKWKTKTGSLRKVVSQGPMAMPRHHHVTMCSSEHRSSVCGRGIGLGGSPCLGAVVKRVSRHPQKKEGIISPTQMEVESPLLVEDMCRPTTCTSICENVRRMEDMRPENVRFRICLRTFPGMSHIQIRTASGVWLFIWEFRVRIVGLLHPSHLATPAHSLPHARSQASSPV